MPEDMRARAAIQDSEKGRAVAVFFAKQGPLATYSGGKLLNSHSSSPRCCGAMAIFCLQHRDNRLITSQPGSGLRCWMIAWFGRGLYRLGTRSECEF